jgi:hypothetical protein
MRLSVVVPLAFTLFGACALERNDDPPAAGNGGTAGSGGAAGSGSGGKNSAGTAGGKGSGATGGANGGDAGAAGGEPNEGGASGEPNGGDAGDDAGGTSGEDGEGGAGGEANGGDAGAGAGSGGTTAGASGTGGAGSGNGGAGGGGSGGTAPEIDMPIQAIQNGPTPTAPVRLARVYVTAVRNSMGNYNLAVQEPQGQTPSGVLYPAYAGITVHIPQADSPEFEDLAGLAIGDCVTVGGSVIEFMSETELDEVNEFRKLGANDCGTNNFPTPYNTAIAPIATDGDGNVAGDQPPATAEPYESVLVRLVAVSVHSIESETPLRFRVAAGGQSNLIVDPFYYGGNFPSVTVNQSVSSITGILNQYLTYRIAPRSSADLVF